MPGGDRTGPRGFGPMTGRRAGYCAGYDRPGFANPGPGYYAWRSGAVYGGWGGGRGWRHGYYATGAPFWARSGAAQPGPEQQAGYLKEADLLREEAARLKDQIEAIHRRIEDLEKTEQ